MKKIYYIAALAIGLAACSNDEDANLDTPVAAEISASIDGSALTRARDTSWEPGDEIGISMSGRYANIKYASAGGDGLFDGSSIYFKNKREPVTLFAYYPFSGEEGTAPGTVGVIEASATAENQVEGVQKNIDFLHAVKENVTGKDPKVNFEFAHKMSKITLTFKSGNDGAKVSKIVSYEIDGLVLDGQFDTASGHCSVKDGASARKLAISLPEGSVTSEVALQSIIVFPQDVESGTVSLRIVDSDDQDFSCTLDFPDNSLLGGNNYQWVINVKKTGLEIDRSTITDWNKTLLETGADSVLQ